ncbi:hypothetical protein D3C71_2047460 [compost metagenome]
MQRRLALLRIVAADAIPDILARYILIAQELEFLRLAGAHGLDRFAKFVIIQLFRFHVITPPKFPR